MTILLPPSGRTGEPPSPGAGPTAGAPAPRRRVPLAVLAPLGGVLAALTTLSVCLLLGLAGWFLVDAGAHGTPVDALRVGALGWLLAHGSGVGVAGTQVTLVPLGLTVLAAWAGWRTAVRTGERLAGHGPDADRLGDGERDWTVPVGAALFVLGYVGVALVTVLAASDPVAGPSVARALTGALLLALVVGPAGLAVGSGRAAVWVGRLPSAVPATLAACARTVLALTAASVLVVLVALVLGVDDVVNVFSRLHTGAGEATTMVAASLALLPNATAYAASWLLGPGFAVGTQTVVSPGLVVLGPVPMFPLLGGLPDPGPTPDGLLAVLAVGPLLAAWAVARTQRRHPTLRWDTGALRGCAAGVLAAVVLAVVAWLAGGAVGPARMSLVGPDPLGVLLHAVPALGVGGLLGGLLATWRQRRTVA
ncbi:hypothetical protein GCM10009737_30230 [Nocardioides lentus]|uniref:Uncharacterized protein n=1 Tax=Nocardioides lentus TaxID=338077 RepID=A0ABP5AZ57_9ACTN